MRILVICLGVIAACGGPEASQDLLAGTWKIDLDASWELSSDRFLSDTIQGADKYPKDPAEKEKVVQKEVRDFLGDYTLVFGKDGKAMETLKAGSGTGTYKVLSQDGGKMSIEMALRRKRTYDVDFQDDDTIHLTVVGRKPMTLVLTRRS